MKKTVQAVCVFSLAFLAAFLFARYTLGTEYQKWDDEGYVLLSVQHYLKGEHLYTHVFTQYGPFYYLVEGALFRILHLPVTLDSGRLLTMMFWLLSSAAFAYFTYKLSGSSLLGGAAAVLGTWLEKVLAAEPNHPQQLVLPILVLACCVALTPTPSAFAILAVLGAGLLLTKINVGLFYFAALFGTLACVLPKGSLRKVAVTLCGAYLLLFPPLLMRMDLSWARWYCSIAVLCGLSTLTCGVLTAPVMKQSRKTWLYVVLGGILATIVIVGVMLMKGSSISTLFHGIVLDPLRHNGRFVVRAQATRRDAFIAIVITAVIAVVYKLRNRPQHALALNSLRFIAGAAGIILLFHSRSFLFDLAPAIPIALLPPVNGQWKQKDYLPRLFVSLLSVTQLLQPYPVAGSQCAIAAAPLLLWCFVCLHDGLEGGVAEWADKRTGGFRAGLSTTSVVGGVAFVLLSAQLLKGGIWRVHFFYPDSDLRGSQNLHLSELQESLYEPIASEISANCDVLFSMPGMGSFNFWSGVPTPNGFNHNAWLTYLGLKEQQSILTALKADPRSCVLYNPQILLLWQSTQHDVDVSPLATYILNEMPATYQRQHYQIRVNPRRASPWVETAAGGSPYPPPGVKNVDF